jgi:hypothetical protein
MTRLQERSPYWARSRAASGHRRRLCSNRLHGYRATSVMPFRVSGSSGIRNVTVGFRNCHPAILQTWPTEAKRSGARSLQ